MLTYSNFLKNIRPLSKKQLKLIKYDYTEFKESFLWFLNGLINDIAEIEKGKNLVAGINCKKPLV